MRLLNVRTLEFEEFIDGVGIDVPLYAILSHTWGEMEVSFADHVGQQSWSKKGYEKIRGCCMLAESEGFQYAWMDTCCIDKSSSAELSEAINSMFKWYEGAAVCYAYLSDVDSSEDPTAGESSFSRSRWFMRGWTLQELLAPGELVFLGSNWMEIGTKKSLCATVSRITGISQKVLSEGSWATYSVAQKMSWASGRHTTRLEDEAYCLMGLFNVNMPLLYGEGRKAFYRLQQEIFKQSDDQSIFAWSYPKDRYSHLQMSGLMAPSPEYFKDAGRIQLMELNDEYENPFEIINGISLDRAPPLQAQSQQMAPVITTRREDGNNAAQLLDPSDTTLVQTLDESSANSKSSTYPNTPPGPGTSFSYIYQPAIMAPLACHIEGYQVFILLTKGSIEQVGWRVLSRLHNPSILAMKEVPQSQLSPLATNYVAISNDAGIGPNWVSKIIWKTMPEILVGSLLSSGYAVYEHFPPGWVYHQSHSSVAQQTGTMFNKYGEFHAPLVLFYHTSGDDEAHPTFFMGAIERFALRRREVEGESTARLFESIN
ncbi:hypothetical protein DL768_006058 [Monosporascus sp. mg162]|nr:hypothetical protein DL768_006058 [Monosporascus sp. mg162]